MSNEIKTMTYVLQWNEIKNIESIDPFEEENTYTTDNMMDMALQLTNLLLQPNVYHVIVSQDGYE
jgi:hypothetical protein